MKAIFCFLLIERLENWFHIQMKGSLREVYLLFLSLLLLTPVFSLNSDGFSLLALKSAITTDPTSCLSSWKETDRNPCHWFGITCISGRVAQISLPNKGFNGYLPSAIGALSFLRNLSLPQNNFTNTIPVRIFNLSSLEYLDLSHNSLTGSIPSEIGTVKKTLLHLDLSSNLLTGPLPASLSELQQLSGTLNLSFNGFMGKIPDSFGNLPVSVSLDLRHNNLSGKVPQIGSLLNQGPTAFTGNPNLCGFPVQKACPSPVNPRNHTNSEEPTTSIPSLSTVQSSIGQGKTKGSRATTITIFAGAFLIIISASILIWFVWRKWKLEEDKTLQGKYGKDVSCSEGEEEDRHKGQLYILDDDAEEGFKLELEELLRASAYVLGKGRHGIVYKVVVGRGMAVAVRRLSDNGGGLRFKDFENEAEIIGRVRHPNIVHLRAYYFASDEKLLISDYIPNGSLRSALHGGPSSWSPPLPWTTRLKIAQGAARGLAYLHEFSPKKYSHGNIKSSKILLDEDFESYISGFGLARLFSATHKSSDSTILKKQNTIEMASTMIGPKIANTISSSYISPEARVSGNTLTQKCDVYSLGIVLLEILTGRSPDSDDVGLESFVRKAFREEQPLSKVVDPTLLHEVYAKKQVLTVFHVALGCTESDPDTRPRMRAVSESLDRIGNH